MLFASGYSFASSTSCAMLSDGEIEAFVTNACSGSSATGKIDLRINTNTGPWEVTYLDNNNIVLSTKAYIVDGNGGEEDKLNLLPGTYRVEVVDNRCAKAVLQVSVGVKTPFNIEAEIINNTYCAYPWNGYVTVTPEGGTPPYTYFWNVANANGNTAGPLNPLSSWVIITDADNCEVTYNFEIKHEVSILDLDVKLPSCEADLVEFTLNPSQTVNSNVKINIFKKENGVYVLYKNQVLLQPVLKYSLDLPDGQYKIKVIKEGLLCAEVEREFEINKLEVLKDWVNVVDQSMVTGCGATNGALAVNYVGPSEYPIEYEWSTGETTPNISNLDEGEYTLNYWINGCKGDPYIFTICDCWGCEDTNQDGTISGTGPTCPSDPYLNLRDEVHPTSGPGLNDGSIDLWYKYDSPNFYVYPTFTWTGPNGFTSTNSDIFNLTEGTYKVIVKMGCSVITRTYTIISCPTPEYAVTVFNSCAGENNGSIRVTRSIGADIAWDHINQKDKFTLNNLSPGIYCFEYTDFPSYCQKRECIEILEIHEDLKLEFSEVVPICPGQKNGVLSVLLLPGVEFANISIDGTSHIKLTSTDKNYHTYLNLTAGNHVLTARSMCEELIYNFTIGVKNVTHWVEGEVINGEEGEFVSPTGKIEVKGLGGSGNFTYEWKGPRGFQSSSQNIFNLWSGSYTLYVTDTYTGCSVRKIFNVQNNKCPVANLSFFVQNTYPDNCMTSSCQEDCRFSLIILSSSLNKPIVSFPLTFNIKNSYFYNATFIINNQDELNRLEAGFPVQPPHVNGLIVNDLRRNISPYEITITDACNYVQKLELRTCPECDIRETPEKIEFGGGLELELNGTCDEFEWDTWGADQWIDVKGLGIGSGLEYEIYWPDNSRSTVTSNSNTKERYRIAENEYGKFLRLQIFRRDGCSWDIKVFFGVKENVQFFLTKEKVINSLTLNGPCIGCSDGGKPQYTHGKEGDECDGWFKKGYQVFSFTPTNSQAPKPIDVCNSGGVFSGYVLVNDVPTLSNQIIVPKNKCVGIAPDNGGHGIVAGYPNQACEYGGGCLFNANDLFPGFKTSKLVELAWCSRTFDVVINFPDVDFEDNDGDPDPDSDSNCISAFSTVSNEKGLNLRLYAKQPISGVKLNFSNGTNEVIDLEKGPNFFSLDGFKEGSHSVIIEIDGCPPKNFSFQISSGCPTNLTLNPIQSKTSTTLSITSTQVINGSRVLIYKGANLVKEIPWDIAVGANTKVVDFEGLGDGFFNVKLDLSNNCTDISRTFVKQPNCPTYGELDKTIESTRHRFWAHIISQENMDATISISQGGSNPVIASQSIKITKGSNRYEFNVSKPLPVGHYFVTVILTNSNCPPHTWNYTVYENLTSCDDIASAIIFDNDEDEYKLFTFNPNDTENSALVTNYTNTNLNKDQYKLENVNISSSSVIRNDKFGNIFVLNNLGTNDVAISKYNKAGSKVWDNIVDGVSLVDFTVDSLLNMELLCYDPVNQKYKIANLDEYGDLNGIKELTLQPSNYDKLHQNGSTTIAVKPELSGNKVLFASESTLLTKDLTSKIKVKDIKTLANGNVLVAGEYNGEININGTIHNSQGYKNAIFITYDVTGNLLSSHSVQNYRDEFVQGIAINKSEEVAYHGNFKEIIRYNIDTTLNEIDSCIFVFVVPLIKIGCDLSNPILTMDEVDCSLSWSNSSQDSVVINLQQMVDSVWTNVPNASSPFTPTNNGSYRLVLSKAGCSDFISDVVEVECSEDEACNEDPIDITYSETENKFLYFYKTDGGGQLVKSEWISPVTYMMVDSFITWSCENITIKDIFVDENLNVYVIGCDPTLTNKTRIIKYNWSTKQIIWSQWYEKFIYYSTMIGTNPLTMVITGFSTETNNWKTLEYNKVTGEFISGRSFLVYTVDGKTGYQVDWIKFFRDKTYCLVSYHSSTKDIHYESQVTKWIASIPSQIAIREVVQLRNEGLVVGGDFTGTFTLNGVVYESYPYRSIIFIEYDKYGTIINVKIYKSNKHQVIKTFTTDGYYKFAYTGYTTENLNIGENVLLDLELLANHPDACAVVDGGSLSETQLRNAIQVHPESVVKFYPNPFTKGINLDIDSPQKDVVSIVVINSIGSVMFTSKVDVEAGQNIKYLNEFEQLPSGVYTVKLKSDLMDHTTRVIRIE